MLKGLKGYFLFFEKAEDNDKCWNGEASGDEIDFELAHFVWSELNQNRIW